MAGYWKSAKTVSESARERETFRYYPSLLSAARFNDAGPQGMPSSNLGISTDTILTAHAQLAACQTGAARSLISLFDQNYQYVVAEATPTLPLLPSLRHEDRQDDVWLCGTAIPRKHGVCDVTLCAGASAELDDSGNPAALPLTKVEDLSTDSRFSSKPYCQPDSPARFYAAVPIRTSRGINIGVLCVVNPVPLDLWNNRHTQVIRNISFIIMEHLEAKRLARAHRHSERMTRGMGSFIEGKSTMAGWKQGPHPAAFEDDARLEGALNANQQLAQSQQDESQDEIAPGSNNDSASVLPESESIDRDGSISDHAILSNVDMLEKRNSAANNMAAGDSTNNLSSDTTIGEIFSKAANIIRESVEVEGCLFLDATMGSFGAMTTHPRTDESAASANQSSSTSSSDEGKSLSGDNPSERSCQVLGYSTSEVSSIDGGDPLKIHLTMSKKFLSVLLRRYPMGKIFNFNRVGELQSSDSSEEDHRSQAPIEGEKTTMQGGKHTTNASNTRQKDSSKPWSRQQEGYTILKVFPGARSLAFVPVWDLRKERWSAGTFVYTHMPIRNFSYEDLSFLRAFGMMAMSEALRLDTALADKAKTDALSSLSHELRSPLHGIVLSIELMEDTQLDVFQGNITHTIETCCRTLVDTVDNLLDFSKINNMLGKRLKRKDQNFARGLRKRSIRSMEAGIKSLYSVVRLDALAEEVVESVFTGFNFQHISVAQLAREEKPRNADVEANRRLDAMRAMEDLEPARVTNGELRVEFGDVSILLWIDPACSWTFYTQAGAVRRIIMNLFGNSLKYTSKGTIKILLRQTTPKMKFRNNERTVVITVADTGKGIGQDYLGNGLFKPFSQEDHLTPGTGLGLSLVKSLTTRLQGRISIESQVGVGTTISVALPLEPVTTSLNGEGAMLDNDQRFAQQVQELRGLRIRLSGFDDGSNSARDPGASALGLTGRAHAESICHDWLQMEVIPSAQVDQTAPDLILWSEDAFRQSSEFAEACPVAPCIVMCSNVLTAHQHTTFFKTNEKQVGFEFITQPLAPRKLAKVLALTFQQWLNRQESFLSSGENDPRSSATAHESYLIPSRISYGPSVAAKGPDTRADSFASNKSRNRSPPEMDSGTTLKPPSPKDMLAPAGKGRFLLVDDNQINLKILASYMKRLGQAYQTATNGLEAVESYLQDPGQYTCIFMDISMPVMDGFIATRRIRDFEAENKLTQVSIFALSGLASVTAQQEAFGSGIDLFLTKPVKLKELGSILRSREMIQ